MGGEEQTVARVECQAAIISGYDVPQHIRSHGQLSGGGDRLGIFPGCHGYGLGQ
jgi:hypothetical protein